MSRNAAVASVDVYLNGRPVATAATPGATSTVSIPDGPADSIVRLDGWDGADLVASHQLTL